VREAVSAPGSGNEANAYFAGFDQFNQFNRFGNQGQASDFREDKRAGRISAGAQEETMEDYIRVAIPPMSDSELNVYV